MEHIVQHPVVRCKRNGQTDHALEGAHSLLLEAADRRLAGATGIRCPMMVAGREGP